LRIDIKIYFNDSIIIKAPHINHRFIILKKNFSICVIIYWLSDKSSWHPSVGRKIVISTTQQISIFIPNLYPFVIFYFKKNVPKDMIKNRVNNEIGQISISHNF